MRSVTFLLLVLFARDAPVGVQTVVHALEQRYHHARTLKAVFYERYMDGNGGVSAESGTAYFSSPGRMRWEYESPEPKLFLIDGPNVWFYVPADRTASRAKLNESSDWRTPLALLVGKANLSRICRSIEAVPSSAGQRSQTEEKPTAVGDFVLRCIPREGPPGDPLRDVLLETDAEGYLTRVVIREIGNVETEFRFGNWEENIAIPEVKFHFAPPPGVSIVDEQTLTGTIH